MDTYEIVRENGRVGIHCFYCGLTSWSEQDVDNHYCGRCGTWHDDRLLKFSKDEWWVVAKRVKPSLTREEFDKHWEDFQRDKAERARRTGTH